MGAGGMGRLISEEVTPAEASVDARAMSRGEPGLPAQFTWRGRRFGVAEVLRTWKSASPEGGRAGANMYVRRHYYEVRCCSGEVMTLYCERQPQSRARAKCRWWLYTLIEPGAP